MQRTLGSFLIFLLSVLATFGETFIGPTTSSNRIVIRSNEAIAITANNVGPGDDFPMTVALQGTTNDVPLNAVLSGHEPYFIAGPAEVINNVDDYHGILLLTFHRLTNSNIHSVFITSITNVITVPDAQTIHFLLLMGEVNFSVQQGTNVVEWGEYGSPVLEFTGPLTLRLSVPSFNQPAFLSYYFMENGFSLPGLRAAAGPTGSFEIAVEKSSDLTNWIPVLLHQTTDPQRSFYRLRLFK